MTEKIGTMAYIETPLGNYSVVLVGDHAHVIKDHGDDERTYTVDGLGAFVTRARDLKIGWGQFPDEAEVLYLYDKGDGCFGYAINLADDWLSEWGYSPFCREETDE
jgi:hypothetical protein